MPRQQFRQMFFMDGNFAGLQSRKFLLVVINANDVVPKLGKASRRNKPNIARSDNRNFHL